MIVRAGAAFTARRGLGGGPSDCDDGVVYVVDQKISKIREVSWGGLTGTLGGIDDLAGAANGCGGNSTFRTPHAVASVSAPLVRSLYICITASAISRHSVSPVHLR